MEPRVRHPEQRDTEAFLGNFTPHDFLYIGWISKRPGQKAQDSRGHRVIGKVPIFVQHEEIERSKYGPRIKTWLTEDGRW